MFRAQVIRMYDNFPKIKFFFLVRWAGILAVLEQDQMVRVAPPSSVLYTIRRWLLQSSVVISHTQCAVHGSILLIEQSGPNSEMV